MSDPSGDLRERIAALSILDDVFRWKRTPGTTPDWTKEDIADAVLIVLADTEAETCGCCNALFDLGEKAAVHNEWEGRLDGYCYECALMRCDAEGAHVLAADTEAEYEQVGWMDERIPSVAFIALAEREPDHWTWHYDVPVYRRRVSVPPEVCTECGGSGIRIREGTPYPLTKALGIAPDFDEVPCPSCGSGTSTPTDDGKAESIRPTCPTWRDEVHTEEAPEWGMYLEGCHRSDCDLQVVRPGKEQCCGDYDGFGCWWTKADALVGLERDENPA